MSVTEDLLDGLANALVVAGIGTYRTDGSAYQAAETAITLAKMPAAPDRCVVLTDYPLSDDPKFPMGVVGVQFKMRGLPNAVRDVMRLRDSIYALLNGLEHQQYGTVHANQIYRSTSIPLGQDEGGRFTYSDNFYVDVDYPATVNRR